MYWYVNRLTGERRQFPYSYEDGLPVGGPDDAEGTPIWVPAEKKEEG